MIQWFSNLEQLLLNFVIPFAILFASTRFETNQIPLATLAFVSANFASAFTGLAISAAFDRRYGTLKIYSISPLGVNGYVTAKILAAISMSLIQTLVLTIGAVILGAHIPALASLTLAMVVSTPVWVSLALTIASVMKAEIVLGFANLFFIGLTASALAVADEWVFLHPLAAEIAIATGSILPAFSLAFMASVTSIIAVKKFKWI